VGELEDREWLLARERGEDVSHIPATTRLTYAHVEWLLAALRDPAPTAGWKRRVLYALDGEPAPAGRNPRPARTERSPRSEELAEKALRTPRS
jgi:hypothetical protein